ncbi:MAG: alpha/beta hydrolase [Myxococcaceae bacterium]
MRLERPDGWLDYEVRGQGPAVVVVHGGGRRGKHYAPLAERLAPRFTVLTYDRRGRGGSSPLPPGHCLQTEIDDLRALCELGGARHVFGHSAGAVITLEAARVLPFDSVAVYEPPIGLERFTDLGWWPQFEAALAKGNEARAFALFASRMRFGPPAWLPVAVLEVGVRFLMRSEQGRELAALMHAVPGDMALAREVGADFERYRAVTVPVLLLGGGASPDYLPRSLDEVAARLPRVVRQVMPGQGHNAPDLTGVDETASLLVQWFTEGEPPRL